MIKLFKKAMLQTALVSVLVSGLLPIASAATDTLNHWAEPIITQWKDKGLIEGYEDGTFRPDHSITRAEIAALINRKINIPPAEAEVTFSDLSREGWQYGPLSAAAEAGYLKGYEDGTIRPDRAVSRQELAVIIHSLLGLETDKEDLAFVDSNEIPAWSKNEIAEVAAKGIMDGYADGTFAPSRAVTRAEAIVTLDRTDRFREQMKPLDYLIAGVFGPEQGNETVYRDVTINEQGVTLRNMTIYGSLLLGERIGEGDVTLQNVKVRGQTTVKGGGANSIHLENSTFDSIAIDKEIGGEVRIVATGATSVHEVEVHSAAMIEEDRINGAGFTNIVLPSDLAEGTEIKLSGEFQGVQVSSKGVKVLVVKGTIGELVLAKGADGNRISLGENVIVKQLVANAAAQFVGQGKIEKAIVNEGAEATTFENKPTSVNGEPAPALAGGGGGGGGGGTGNNSQPQPVNLTIRTSVIGYKTIEVNFSQAVDPSTTDIKLQNPGVDVEQLIYSADRKKAALTVESAFTKGTYTIMVSQRTSNGVKNIEQDITVEDERVDSFVYLLDSALWDTLVPDAIKVKFKLTNQYGEDVTSRYGREVKISLYPTVPTNAVQSSENGLATLKYHRALVENEKLFIYAFYGTTISMKKELIVSRKEIPASSPGEYFVIPFEVKGLYHPDNKQFTVNSNFGEYSILFRWKGNSEIVSENISTDTSDYDVLTVKTDLQGPVLGTVIIGNESWSTLTLARGSYPYPGTYYVILVDKITGFFVQIPIRIYPDQPYPPIAQDVFVVGDKLIAGYNRAGDYSSASWTLRGSVSQAVYHARYSNSIDDIGIFTIQEGTIPSDIYTIVPADGSNDYKAVMLGTVTVSGAVYGKVYYNGPEEIKTVINDILQDPLEPVMSNLTPLAVNDLMRVFYGDKHMVRATWNGTRWNFNELLKEAVTAPMNVNAVAISNDQIRLSWTAVENADHYNIYFSNTESGDFTSLKDANGNDVKITETTFIDNNLPPVTSKYYMVRAAISGTNWEVESKPSSIVSATTYANEHITLDFQVADSVQHPSQPILYLTDKQNSKLHAINYETGAKTSLELPLPPESLTFANGKVYVSLLKGQHSSYWWDEDQRGAVAIVDASSLSLVQTFDIAIDPFDIVVDRSEYIYITSGSGQWTHIKSYSPTVYEEVYTSGIRQASYIHMHPSLNRIYAIDTDVSPRDMEVFNVSNGQFLPGRHDSPYHGDYGMSRNMSISPDGAYIFNGAGTVFRTSESLSDDMRYVFTLNKGYSDIAFELNEGRFYTAADGFAGAYHYDNFEQFGKYRLDGSTKFLYNSAEQLVSVSTIGTGYTIELIDKDAMEIIPPVQRPDIYLHGTVSDVVYDAYQNKAYALDEAFNKLYVVDLANNEVERTVSLSYRPSEMTISEEGTKLYIRNNDANALVTEIDLNDFQEERYLFYQAPSDYSDPAHGHIYQRGDDLYVVTGEWAPRLLLFNATTFEKVDYGTEISSIGDLAFSNDNSKLYYWFQYGWSAGSANTDVYEISKGGATFTQTDRSQIGYPEFSRDPLDTPILLLEGRDLVIAKNRVLNMNNLNQTVAILMEPIYAVSPDGTKLVGKNGLYDARTYQKLQSLSLSGASEIFYANGRLYYLIGNTLHHL